MNRWEDLPSELPLSPATLDIDSQLGPPFGERTIEGLSTSLGELWAALARESLAGGSPRWAWAGTSTLVACTPSDVPETEFIGAAHREAASRGANHRAPLYPVGDKPGARWAFYREWFAAARELDEGSLRATAFYDPDAAVPVALRAAPRDVDLAYDDRAGLLSLSADAGRAEIDAVAYSFMGLMRGFLPEQALAAAVRDAAERLRRLERLREEARRVVAAEEIRFVDEAPAYRTRDGVVVIDALATGFLDGGELPEDWPRRLADASRPAFTTPCTCGEERRVRAGLRPRAEVDPLDGTGPPHEVLWSPVGERFCAVWELTCSHAAHRPRAKEWTDAGFTVERCEEAWRETLARDGVLAAAVGGWFSRAAVVHGREAGAIAASGPLLGALALALGFAPGETLTIYAPRAGLLFLTDEELTEEEDLRGSLHAGGLEAALEEQGLHLGPDVGYLAGVRVEGAAPIELPIHRLRI